METEMNEKHGGDIYRNSVDYDFSVNINPLGMPQGSIRAAVKGIEYASHYPDDRGQALRMAIARAQDIKPDHIILGNGAAELIYALCYAVKPAKGLILSPCFLEYEAAVKSAGGQPVYWKLQQEKEYLLEEDFLPAITRETEIVFLCSPNNPTGKLINRELLFQIAQKCELTETFFCLDECFLPFLETERELTMLGQLQRFPHLIILRAFTKIYAMPGLRLGYAACANTGLLLRMRGAMQPWNTSIPAQLAGIAALEDGEYLKRTRQVITQEKIYLLKELSDGLTERIYTPEANYIFFRARPDLKEALLSQRILIRSCENYRNLSKGFFRIGIRMHEENQELIRRWRSLDS